MKLFLNWAKLSEIRISSQWLPPLPYELTGATRNITCRAVSDSIFIIWYSSPAMFGSKIFPYDRSRPYAIGRINVLSSVSSRIVKRRAIFLQFTVHAVDKQLGLQKRKARSDMGDRHWALWSNIQQDTEWAIWHPFVF